MNREGLRDDMINLAFFWPSILGAWIIAWLRFRNADQVTPPIVPSRIMALWIVLAVILGLLSVCVLWLIVKRARIGRLDPLPWYLVVGPRGSGKTVLLTQAGVRQVAAWNDDSFVAHHSIILDQVGGYILDEIQQADPNTRREYLADVEAFLRGKSLKGIIATIEVDAALDAAGSAAQAQTLRTHLAEITHRFGVHLPVYLVITRCDHLPGFLPFFQHLPPTDRANAWGATLSGQQRDALTAFDQECALLQRALADRRLAFLDAPHPATNRAIYQFPAEFALLCERLRSAVETIFTGSSPQERLLFRGFYFTGASPAERALDDRSARGGV
ncbi:MAG TPA: type VI secretion protein IcmF/TssM N-terminal domain-containing protein [Herpetosiphonaceae bacterium]